jgi:alpha-tubulin suppressor-like RCC1 family protein
MSEVRRVCFWSTFVVQGVAVVGAAHLGACSVPVEESEPVATVSDAITNAPSTTGWPSAVSVFIHSNGLYCGASILSRHWILTAAHCLEQSQNGTQVDVNSGTATLFSGLANYYSHPDYDGTSIWGTADTDDDVGLVKLSGAGVQPMPAQAGIYSDPYLAVGDHVTIVGFGKGSDPGQSSDCDRGTLGTKRFKEYSLKTVEFKLLEIDYGSSEICPGDSGSGWLISLDNVPMVASVTSNRRVWDDADSARLVPKVDWILSQSSQAGQRLSCPLFFAGDVQYHDCFEVDQRAHSMSAGGQHACAALWDGRVRCWGRNTEGQLGDSTQNTRLQPVTVSFSGRQATQVAAGRNHTCAAFGDGLAACWGSNADGQLGNFTLGSGIYPAPVLVTKSDGGLLTNVRQVTAGANHSCAVTTDGYAYCWGQNTQGQLGNDSTTSSNVATLVGHWQDIIFEPGAATASAIGDIDGQKFIPLKNVAWIDAGYYHTCATRSNGDAYCWGDNAYGQIGNGNTTDQHAPTWIATLSNVYRISAGLAHTCATYGNFGSQGACWGYNGYGQFGNGTNTSSYTPVGVPHGMGVLTEVSAGSYHTCFGGGSGSHIQKCAGYNGTGALGTNGSTTNVLTQAVVGNVDDLSAGELFTCALLVNGAVVCMGSNGYGQLGQGSYESKPWGYCVRDLHRGLQ